MEKRTFEFTEIEIDKRDDGQRKLVGHAAVFNKIVDLGWFREKIEPGTFSESIQSDDVRALINHDPNLILGRNKAQTLNMKEDKKGLGVKIYPPDTQYARDLIVSVDRGDINQMSFAFQVVEEEWIYAQKEDKDKDLRILKKVKLYDVSPVTYPAYEGTDLSTAKRSHDDWQKQNDLNKKRRKFFRKITIKEKESNNVNRIKKSIS